MDTIGYHWIPLDTHWIAMDSHGDHGDALDPLRPFQVQRTRLTTLEAKLSKQAALESKVLCDLAEELSWQVIFEQAT